MCDSPVDRTSLWVESVQNQVESMHGKDNKPIDLDVVILLQ